MKTLEQSILDRILFIGNKLPELSENDNRPKFILLGTPQEFIDENKPKKSLDDIRQWIAEYCYKMANPNTNFSEPPSIVYEQVEKDFNKFLTN